MIQRLILPKSYQGAIVQKKIEILNCIKPVSTIFLTTKIGNRYVFDVRTEATEHYGTYFLDRVMTPLGLATAIGVNNNQMWFWVDNYYGPTYWDDFFNIDSSKGFSEIQNTDYPDMIKNPLNKAVGFDIPFEEFESTNPLDLFNLLQTLDQHTPESLAKKLKLQLKKAPDDMSKQLVILIQKFETLSVTDLESLAELTEPVTESLGPQLINFIQDTKLDNVAKISGHTINNTIAQLQDQINEIAESLKQVQQKNQPALYDTLIRLKLSLEESQQQLIHTVETLDTVDSKITQLKRINPFCNFNLLLGLLINTYYEFQINPNHPLDVGHYLEGASRITQFLYDHGHHFFDVEAEQGSNNSNKQEQSESLNRIELMYLFLLLSGSDGISKTLHARVYLKLFEVLAIKPNDDENMPETFNLLNFIKSKPDDFIKLYRSFFVSEGPCKQKVEELIAKKHPFFLIELGKLTSYYVAALKNNATKPDSKPGTKLEIDYYFKQGVSYFLAALKQGLPQAAESVDAMLATDKGHQENGMGEIAKELAAYYASARNFVKAHYYLTIALKLQDKGTKELQQELDYLQIKVTLLEHHGEEQKQAISALLQKVKEGNQPAFALLKELSTQVPAVALAAVVYWHQEHIKKLSPTVLKCAAQENPDVVAWYQNRYQEEYHAQRPDLDLILKAVKVGFAPAISELNGLLISDTADAQKIQYKFLGNISDFDIAQHITPKSLVALLVRYRTTGNLTDEALNGFVLSLAHTSFKNSTAYLELLILVLRDCSASIGSEELMAVLHAIKRAGGITEENKDLLKTIATLIIERAASENNSMFHSFVQEFIPSNPDLARILYNDSEAWGILKSNDQIANMIIRIIEELNESKEGSALSILSLFSEKNKEKQMKLSKEEKDFDVAVNLKISQKGIEELAKAEVAEEPDSYNPF